MYSQLRTTKKKDDEAENKIPDFTIPLIDLKKTIKERLDFELTDDILEIIFYALKIPLKKDTQIDFLLFFKIYYLIETKIAADQEEEEEEKALEEQQDEQNEEIGESQEKDEMTKKLEYYEKQGYNKSEEVDEEGLEEGEYVGEKGQEEEQ